MIEAWQIIAMLPAGWLGGTLGPWRHSEILRPASGPPGLASGEAMSSPGGPQNDSVLLC